jgi:hypothetical protein
MSHDQRDINVFRRAAQEWAFQNSPKAEHYQGPSLRYDNGFSGWCLTLCRNTITVGTEKVQWPRISIMIHGEDIPKKYRLAANHAKSECQDIVNLINGR